jgi:hypothetical protein
MKQLHYTLALLVAFTSIALGQGAQPKHEMGSQKVEISLYPTAEIQWKDGPASLPAGAKVAVLEGDPSKDVFHNATLVARRVQDSATLASEGGACHRDLGHFQLRYGRQVRSNRNSCDARRDLWLLARGHEAFRLGKGRYSASTSWHWPVGNYLP